MALKWDLDDFAPKTKMTDCGFSKVSARSRTPVCATLRLTAVCTRSEVTYKVSHWVLMAPLVVSNGQRGGQ
jgi:hypothetical protein